MIHRPLTDTDTDRSQSDRQQTDNIHRHIDWTDSNTHRKLDTHEDKDRKKTLTQESPSKTQIETKPDTHRQTERKTQTERQTTRLSHNKHRLRDTERQTYTHTIDGRGIFLRNYNKISARRKDSVHFRGGIVLEVVDS